MVFLKNFEVFTFGSIKYIKKLSRAFDIPSQSKEKLMSKQKIKIVNMVYFDELLLSLRICYVTLLRTEVFAEKLFLIVFLLRFASVFPSKECYFHTELM